MRECESNNQEIIIYGDSKLSRRINEFSNCQTNKIDEYNFTQLYQKDEINKDKKLTNTETGIKNEKLAETLLVGAVTCEWLGSQMAVVRPSAYDIDRQKVDLLAECAAYPSENYGEEPPVLAISIAINEHPKKEKNPDKLKTIPVKYFQSPIYGTPSALESVIMVNVTISRENANKLNKLLENIQQLIGNIHYNTQEQTQQLKEMMDKFANHPTHLQILKDISNQLEFFVKQASAETKKDDELTPRLKTLNDIIGIALAEKEQQLEDGQ